MAKKEKKITYVVDYTTTDDNDIQKDNEEYIEFDTLKQAEQYIAQLEEEMKNKPMTYENQNLVAWTITKTTREVVKSFA